MEQLNLFNQEENQISSLLEYKPNLFNADESDFFIQKFIKEVPWEQKVVDMYGKQVVTPRLTAWYGNQGAHYSFSNKNYTPLPWTKELLIIKSKVEPIAGIVFNSVLLNYYRNGNDSVAWHSDNENVLGKNPLIASVSFGQTRTFDIRNKQDHNKKYSIQLESGSLLLMKGNLQEHWEHRIAKSIKPMTPRINLTFRVIRIDS